MPSLVPHSARIASEIFFQDKRTAGGGSNGNTSFKIERCNLHGRHDKNDPFVWQEVETRPSPPLDIVIMFSLTTPHVEKVKFTKLFLRTLFSRVNGLVWYTSYLCGVILNDM